MTSLRVFRDVRSYSIAAFLCLALFVLDVYTPRGAVIPIGFIPLVFMGQFFPKARRVLLLAGSCTVFTILAVFLEPPSSESEWLEMTNRALAILAQWTAYGLVMYSRKQDTLQDETSHALATAVAHKEALIRAIVSSSDDAIINKSLKGQILSWNQAAQLIFGYTAEEAIGKHITMLIPGELRPEEDIILGQISSGIP